MYIYYALLIWSLFSLDAVYAAERDLLEKAMHSYFLCEAVGHVPGRCSRETLERYSHPLASIAVYNVLLFFVPIINLVFIVNWRSIQESVRRLKVMQTLKSFSSKSSQS